MANNGPGVSVRHTAFSGCLRSYRGQMRLNVPTPRVYLNGCLLRLLDAEGDRRDREAAPPGEWQVTHLVLAQPTAEQRVRTSRVTCHGGKSLGQATPTAGIRDPGVLNHARKSPLPHELVV